MPFPRAKASLYDAGSRVPLAIQWPKGIIAPGRVFDGPVNLSDLAPTFLAATGLQIPEMMTARSLMDVIKNSPTNNHLAAFIAMERHDGCREGGKGYPCRAIRTNDFLYILNHESGRWPAGNPNREFCARYIPFGEVDSSPTKTLLMDNKDNPEANVLLMTTECLQNQLLHRKENAELLDFNMNFEKECGTVIFDELHYLSNRNIIG